jgi:Dolichyl-phosphate-mannose-protein mannosyltransferase
VSPGSSGLATTELGHAERTVGPVTVVSRRPNEDRSEETRTLDPFAWRTVLVASAAMVAMLMAYAGRYGYHRDELYFLSCAKRMAWGFVDQPPVTPLIAKISEAIAPGSLVVLRVWPALFSAASMGLAVLCARELGAGRLGQTATAVALAAAPGILAGGHMLSTATLDITLWVAVTLLVLRLLRTGDTRIWLAIGAVLGVGLMNKWTIGFLVAGLLVGILAGSERRLLKNGWFAAGVAVALVLWAPNLSWQAQHDWPQIEMLTVIQERSSGVGETLSWIPLQFAITGFLATPLWIAGLWRVLRSDDARPFRALGIAYVVLAFVLAIVAGDKPYYVAALYLPLVAGGAVPFERWWAGNARRVRVVVSAVLALLTIGGYPIVLPILPASALADVPLQDVNYDLGEQIAWPTFVSQIEEAWAQIPPDERATAIVLTGNYGEAGAIERYGESLPTPYSGHVTWWWWRMPSEDTTTVLAVGVPEWYLRLFFDDLEPVGRLDNGLDVETEEQGNPLIIARSPKESLPAMWPDLRHYT